MRPLSRRASVPPQPSRLRPSARRSAWLVVALTCASACGADETPGDDPNAGTGGTSPQAGRGGSANQAGRAGSGATNGGSSQAGTGGNVAGSGGTTPSSGGAAGSSATGATGPTGGTAGATGGIAGTGGSAGTSSTTGGASGSGAGGTTGGSAGASGGTSSTGGNSAGSAGAAGANTAGTGGAAPTGPVTVFIAGDSTVSTYRDTASESDQAGWGQMIGELFDDRVTIENRAVGGMTARHFIENGYLDDIFEDIAPGDYLLVQFGTNDGNRTATYELNGETIPYYLDPATDFKTYLRRYIEGAADHDAHLVFVTPPPRNSAYCTGGNGTGGHATAMRELGMAENIPVSDLNGKSVAYLQAICPAPTPEDFFLRRTDGSVDGTHFQEHGARVLASLVAEGISEANLPLAAYLKP